MKFQKSELKIDIYGQEVTLSFPTIMQLKELDKKATKKGADEIGESISFLEKLGLPKHIAEELEPQHFKDIIEALTVKKN